MKLKAVRRFSLLLLIFFSGLGFMAFAQSDYPLDKIRLTCQVPEGCPREVGVLLTIEKVLVSGRPSFLLSRCSATLIAPDKIITNDHCVKDQTTDSYFVFDADRTRIVRVLRTLERVNTSEDAQKKVINGLDVAVLQLTEPIRDLRARELPRNLAPQRLSQLTAYVINQAADPSGRVDQFVINALRCDTQTHPVLFPFSFVENPDGLMLFGCTGIPGNSGAAFFSQDSLEIQAILNSSVTINSLGSQNVMASNLRCVSLPSVNLRSQNCVRSADVDLSAERSLKTTIADLEEAFAVNRMHSGFQFKNVAYQIRDSAFTYPNSRFEVIAYPKCREPGVEINNQIPFYQRHLQIRYNSQGRLSVTEARPVLISGAVLRRQGDRFEVKVNWPSPLGPYLANQPRTIRTQWDETFTIDIPVCPR